MGLLDGLEKLINEHGSAVILKERIALANDKYAALDDKAKGLQLQVERLQADNARLVEENTKLKASQIPKPTAPAVLEEVKERLLVVAANSSSSRSSSTRDLATAVGCSENVAEFHLTELERSKLMGVAYSMSTAWNEGGARWSINHEGRRYLMERGLLQ
jgi:beta-phosphoglucomutase-like phosphatase (HAD superfamily)